MSEEDYLRIGRILGVHGLAGRLKVLLTSDIRERFQKGHSVFIGSPTEFHSYVIAECLEYKKNVYLLRFDDIGTREQADGLRGRELYIAREEAERSRHLLDADEFYFYDLIGCAVYRDGVLFGTVTSIMEAGAGEILAITDGAGREHFIPFVREMVDTGAVTERRIDITPVEGLIE